MKRNEHLTFKLEHFHEEEFKMKKMMKSVILTICILVSMACVVLANDGLVVGKKDKIVLSPYMTFKCIPLKEFKGCTNVKAKITKAKGQFKTGNISVAVEKPSGISYPELQIGPCVFDGSCTIVVSGKFDGTTKKIKIPVVVKEVTSAYKCPVKSFKVGSIDFTKLFKKSNYIWPHASISEYYKASKKQAKNLQSGKIAIKPQKGWKITAIRQVISSSGKTYYLSNGKKSKGIGRIEVALINTKTNVQTNLAVQISE